VLRVQQAGVLFTGVLVHVRPACTGWGHSAVGHMLLGGIGGSPACCWPEVGCQLCCSSTTRVAAGVLLMHVASSSWAADARSESC
jgi:hypothetical protein